MDDYDNDFAEYMEFHDENDFPAPKRYIRDVENPLEVYNDQQFKRRFRFRKLTVVNILLPMLATHASNRGLPISPLMKILIALRFYASSFQLVCADLYKVSQSTVSRIVTEVFEIIACRIRTYIKFPGDQHTLNQIKTTFFQHRGFPGVIGLIDGTHIAIKSPGGDNAEVFRNRKTFFSLNVQVVAGPSEEIMDIVVRWPGSAHDSRIFDNSGIRVKLSEGHVQGHLLGDSGYPQRQYIYTPVPQPNTQAEFNYNAAHRITSSLVERTIGRWKRRFPCLYFELQNKLRTTLRIVTACAVLYNIGIRDGDLWEVDELEGGREVMRSP